MLGKKRYFNFVSYLEEKEAAKYIVCPYCVSVCCMYQACFLNECILNAIKHGGVINCLI